MISDSEAPARAPLFALEMEDFDEEFGCGSSGGGLDEDSKQMLELVGLLAGAEHQESSSSGRSGGGSSIDESCSGAIPQP